MYIHIHYTYVGNLCIDIYIYTYTYIGTYCIYIYLDIYLIIRAEIQISNHWAPP